MRPIEPSSPILSLTLIDGRSLDGDGRLAETSSVLIAVRDPSTNITHPNVVSVPTMRIPQALFDACVDEATHTGGGADGHVTYFRGGVTNSETDNGHASTLFATESLLTRKLGLGAAVETGQARYRAAVRSIVRGVAAYDGADGRACEPVSMLNVVAVMDDGFAQLPMRSASYSVLAWTSVARFLEGVETRNPMQLSDDVDPIEVCVHGVCLDAARASIDHLVGRDPVGGADARMDQRLIALPGSLWTAEEATHGR